MIPLLTPDKAGLFRVWDPPIDDVEYVIGIDVAEGRRRDRTPADRRRMGIYVDARPDYSAAVVLELATGLHVATWHGYLTPDQFAVVCAAIGFYYNSALLVPEINGPGLVVVSRLAETVRYPSIYRTRMFNVLDRDPLAPALGWRTDQHTRTLLISRIHEAMNGGHLFTRDQRLINELRTMEFDDQGVARARGNDKDDCVIALGLALQGRYESLGGNQDRPAPRHGRSYDDMVWNKVRERTERLNERSRPGGAGRGSAQRRVLPRPGRWHAGW